MVRPRSLLPVAALAVLGACAGGASGPPPPRSIPSTGVHLGLPAPASASVAASALIPPPAPSPINNPQWSDDGRFLVASSDDVIVFETERFTPRLRVRVPLHTGRVVLSGHWLLVQESERLTVARLDESTITSVTPIHSEGDEVVTPFGLVSLREGCTGGRAGLSLCLLRPTSPAWTALTTKALCPAQRPLPTQVSVRASTSASALLDLSCDDPRVPRSVRAQGNDDQGSSIATLVSLDPLRSAALSEGHHWHGMVFSPDGRRSLVTPIVTADAELFDTASGKLVRSLNISPGPPPSGVGVFCETVSDQFAVVIAESGVHVFTTATGALLGRIPAPAGDATFYHRCEVQVRDQTLRVTVPDHHTLKSWSLPDLRPQAPRDLPEGASPYFDPTGHYMVNYDLANTVTVTDLTTGTRHALEVRGWPQLDPRGRWLAAGDTVWSLATGEKVADLTP